MTTKTEKEPTLSEILARTDAVLAAIARQEEEIAAMQRKLSMCLHRQTKPKSGSANTYMLVLLLLGVAEFMVLAGLVSAILFCDPLAWSMQPAPPSIESIYAGGGR